MHWFTFGITILKMDHFEFAPYIYGEYQTIYVLYIYIENKNSCVVNFEYYPIVKALHKFIHIFQLTSYT